MSLADFMLPQVGPKPMRMRDLAHTRQPSRLFAGYNQAAGELLINGQVTQGIETLTDDHLETNYKSLRSRQFIASLPAQFNGAVLWDMEDSRAFDTQVYAGSNFNVFQYNRRAGNRHAVLWRLISYFEPSKSMGHGGWMDDKIPFSDKKPVVFWRGAISGTHWITPHKRIGALSVDSPATFKAWAKHFSRFDAALSHKGSQVIDIKITGPGPILETKPWLDDLGIYEADVRPAQQLENKYILCLNGNDVASNLYWAVGTQSLAFKEECSFEVVPDYFLRPWVHYVPVAAGLADLQEKFEYCESHPDVCLRIIADANEAYRQMIDPGLWAEAEQDVLSRLGLI